MKMGPTAARAREITSASEHTGPNRDLRDVARQLEGVFLQQLFQVMRESAPEATTATARTSNEFFGTIMDEHLAQAATNTLSNSLSEALYRQLVGLAGLEQTPTPVPSGEDLK